MTATTTTAATEPLYWSTMQKIALRFFLVFFPLYILFNPNGVLPYTDSIAELYIQPFHVFIPWIAKNILHLAKPITVLPMAAAIPLMII